jgi:hypothetical protein
MATYTNNCIKGKLNEEVLVFTAGERDRNVPYHLKERSKGNFKADLNEIKKLLVYMIKETTATSERLTKENNSLLASVINEEK